MSSLVSSYRALAEQFQAAKIAGDATLSGRAYTEASGKLKEISFLVVRDYRILVQICIQNSNARAKAIEKFVKWQKEATEEGLQPDKKATYSSSKCMEVLSEFEKKFVDFTKDDSVMAARAAKKALKSATFEHFAAGGSVEELQAQLEGLSEKTIQKIAYWKQKYDSLKA